MKKKSKKIVICGRLNGPKGIITGKIITEVSPVLFKKFRGLTIEILGAPVTPEHKQMEKKFPGVTFLGFQEHPLDFFQMADIVIGSGRVAIEALKCSRPVIAIGEKKYIGPVSADNMQTCLETNFGDCNSAEDYNWEKMADDIIAILSSDKIAAKHIHEGNIIYKQWYSTEKIMPNIEKLYRESILRKNLEKRKEIPVLMYHQVVNETPADSVYNIYITTQNLNQQLKWLKENGYTAIHFRDIFSGKLPQKPVILTFDDGYKNNYENLLPLLKLYQMKAVVYVLANPAVKKNYWDKTAGEPQVPLMTLTEIRKAHQSGLIEIGSHGLNHLSLTEIKADQVYQEILESKNYLEKQLKSEVLSFAYPYGNFNQNIKEMVQKAGYIFGVATNSGPAVFKNDFFCVRRIQIFPHTNLREFKRKCSGHYLRYRDFKSKYISPKKYQTTTIHAYT